MTYTVLSGTLNSSIPYHYQIILQGDVFRLPFTPLHHRVHKQCSGVKESKPIVGLQKLLDRQVEGQLVNPSSPGKMAAKTNCV